MNYHYEIAAIERAFADLLAAYPELEEDETLRADMLEGETDADFVLSRLLTEERDANSMSAAIGERIKDLQARKSRSDKRKDAMRSLMLKLMKVGGITKRKLAEATISVGKGRDSVEITDEALIAPRFMRVVKSPDKTAIKEALDAGRVVKGAAIKVGDETLSVRVA